MNTAAETKWTPKVKALVWHYFDVNTAIGKGVWDATTPWTTYTIEYCNEELPYFCPKVGNQFATLEEAKAAVQADFESRILSALDLGESR